MSEPDESFVAPPDRKRKKGTKSKDYKHEVIRKARLKNESYINYRGQRCNPKPHGDSCRCRHKCLDSLSENEKSDLYSKFISFNTKNEQDAYLQNLISMKPIVRRRPRVKPGENVEHINKPKGTGFAYSLPLPSGNKEVCKVAFLNCHGISTDRVRRLCDLLVIGQKPKDYRGRNRPGNAKPFAKIKLIEDHIKSLSELESLHSSGDRCMLLSPKLNMRIMWEMFQKSHADVEDISYHYYLKVYRENLKLEFGLTKG